ncbi:hypothetical protein PZB74_01915 [Porifericola rhodea]|uniref:hypothetical protein n=1 Tax=Porifericola rhodea TaxID=930972 RepID=UPI002665AE7E|nr:hypothetical protein [Porifericola rhodea]WKN32108.1 hypothetical protein PZB74_01915 [Porifericola rhodea]
MASIKQHISKLNQNEWDYYSEVEYLKLKNPFTSKLSHKKFVEQYFKRSGKNEILNFLEFLPGKKLDNNRTKHTNSIFFLGILLYKETNLNNPFFESLNSSEYRRFPFLWFLTCLFHDFGFTIENDVTAIEGINNLSNLKSKYSIENCLLAVSPINVNSTLFEVIESYFLYSLYERKVIDHGILAGLYFYDRLLKIRRNKILNNEATRFWGEELEDQYAQVAAAIAIHNIWIPTKDNYETYRKYHLEKLIDDYKPINFSDFPLLYILGVVDTIDPLKMYMREGFRPNEILESLDLTFYQDKITFRNGKKSRLDFGKMIDSAYRLEGWLNVGVKDNKREVSLLLR